MIKKDPKETPWVCTAYSSTIKVGEDSALEAFLFPWQNRCLS